MRCPPFSVLWCTAGTMLVVLSWGWQVVRRIHQLEMHLKPVEVSRWVMHRLGGQGWRRATYHGNLSVGAQAGLWVGSPPTVPRKKGTPPASMALKGGGQRTLEWGKELMQIRVGTFWVATPYRPGGKLV